MTFEGERGEQRCGDPDARLRGCRDGLAVVRRKKIGKSLVEGPAQCSGSLTQPFSQCNSRQGCLTRASSQLRER
jgi:hypothetical protein